MVERFSRFPSALAERSRPARFGDVPVLLAHPDWSAPAPTVIWMHGRTVSKEIDPGRYLRWIRAGIAACAIDLPGHGERLDAPRQGKAGTIGVIAQMVREIDRIVESLAAPEHAGLFDLDRLAIGGMSAGGMAALRRLCDPHPFIAAAVEGTTGCLEDLYLPTPGPTPDETPPDQTLPDDATDHRAQSTAPREAIRAVDAAAHIATWRPIPLLMLHSETDRVIPFALAQRFARLARTRSYQAGADPALVQLRSWPETGAPDEHAGFGRVAAEAKTAQVEFFQRTLRVG